MATIDLKLKSYDELVFEITTLTTNNYLLQQKVERLEKTIKYAQKIEQEYSALLTENTELENIRKEAIKEIAYWGIDKEHNDNSAMRFALKNLLNILNKGSESDVNTTN